MLYDQDMMNTIKEIFKSNGFVILRNGTISVDVFFALSGFLSIISCSN